MGLQLRTYVSLLKTVLLRDCQEIKVFFKFINEIS